jgi:AcrR family transcriptional regulator
MTHDQKTLKNRKNEMTRERILDEAEVLFASKGYHAVSVREITLAANCNLAAVNYHFGNKQNLYLEVFRSRWLPRANRIHKCFRESLAANETHSPNAVVQSLAKAFLDGPMTDQERRRHHQLISGELAQPTEAFELVADQVLRPLFNNLLDDLRIVMSDTIFDMSDKISDKSDKVSDKPDSISGRPDKIKEEQLALNAFSILALILYFNLARPFISRFTGSTYDADFKTRLVDHIVEFSLNGIGASKKEI